MAGDRKGWSECVASLSEFPGGHLVGAAARYLASEVLTLPEEAKQSPLLHAALESLARYFPLDSTLEDHRQTSSPKTSELQFESAKGLLIARLVKQQQWLRRSFLPRRGANFDSVTASAPCLLDPPRFSRCVATPPARRSAPSPALAPPMPWKSFPIFPRSQRNPSANCYSSELGR